MRNIIIFVVGILCAAAARADSSAQAWASLLSPTPKSGTAQSIGTYTSGCLAGAATLPVNGAGYQVMRLSRHRFFGHDSLIEFIEDLGRFAADQRLGTVLVGDLGQPRGGPTLTGHRSHQTGLDVDIWFTLNTPANDRILSENERETLSAPSLVNLTTDAIDYHQWSSSQARLLEHAARHPNVDRIFVNASIKRELCRQTSPTANQWLRKIRPWWKHDDHFHVRLKCPEDSPDCKSQEPLPAGNGCDASLDWWFSAEAKLPSKAKPVPPPPLPVACEQILRQ